MIVQRKIEPPVFMIAPASCWSVGDDHAPHAQRLLAVRAVHGALGERQPGGRHGRHHRLEEQVDHLAAGADAELGDRSAHGHPHQQRRDDDEEVHAVVQGAVRQRGVDDARGVADDDRHVEDDGGDDRMAQPAHDAVQRGRRPISARSSHSGVASSASGGRKYDSIMCWSMCTE